MHWSIACQFSPLQILHILISFITSFGFRSDLLPLKSSHNGSASSTSRSYQATIYRHFSYHLWTLRNDCFWGTTNFWSNYWNLLVKNEQKYNQISQMCPENYVIRKHFQRLQYQMFFRPLFHKLLYYRKRYVNAGGIRWVRIGQGRPMPSEYWHSLESTTTTDPTYTTVYFCAAIWSVARKQFVAS